MACCPLCRSAELLLGSAALKCVCCGAVFARRPERVVRPAPKRRRYPIDEVRLRRAVEAIVVR